MEEISQDPMYFVLHSRSPKDTSFFIYQDGRDVVCIGECSTGKMGVTHGWSHAEAREIADRLLVQEGHVMATANSLAQVFSLMEAFDKVF